MFASAVSFGSTNVDLPEYTWYQFRIPIRQYDEKIGNIQDFRSIQFIRLFLTEFEKPLTLRFAKFELIRNQWRVYDGVLKNGTDANPIDPDVTTTFFQTAVNFEENSENFLLTTFSLQILLERMESVKMQTRPFN